MSNVALILDVSVGYVAGKAFWELALVGAHQVGRLSVRMVMRLARQDSAAVIHSE